MLKNEIRCSSRPHAGVVPAYTAGLRCPLWQRTSPRERAALVSSTPTAPCLWFAVLAVSTDVAGISDLIQNGVLGRVLPRGNSAALAGAIIECLNDPDQARAIGANGKLACDGLRDRGEASYIASYRDVLGGVAKSPEGGSR